MPLPQLTHQAMQTTGWLFDLYPLGDRMVLWFITASGQRLRLTDDFPYCLYLGGPQARLRSLARRFDADAVLYRLTELFVSRRPPEYIRSDNGPEFTARAVRE